MDEQREGDAPESDEIPPAASAPRADAKPSGHGRRWVLMIIAGIFLLPLLGMAVWTAITLNWSYSDGTRAGYVQKFSQKGWLCKTWEGEIAISNVPGQLQEKFDFTVRSDSVAREINKFIGSRVALTYQEHRGVPGSCFGDTQYYVTGVKIVP